VGTAKSSLVKKDARTAKKLSRLRLELKKVKLFAKHAINAIR
jgi:hypothetical protein